MSFIKTRKQKDDLIKSLKWITAKYLVHESVLNFKISWKEEVWNLVMFLFDLWKTVKMFDMTSWHAAPSTNSVVGHEVL